MLRLSFCFGVLLIGLILRHAGSGQAGTGAADDAFYNPPASLSVAVPGTVIRMRPLAGAAAQGGQWISAAGAWRAKALLTSDVIAHWRDSAATTMVQVILELILPRHDWTRLVACK